MSNRLFSTFKRRSGIQGTFASSAELSVLAANFPAKAILHRDALSAADIDSANRTSKIPRSIIAALRKLDSAPLVVDRPTTIKLYAKIRERLFRKHDQSYLSDALWECSNGAADTQKKSLTLVAQKLLLSFSPEVIRRLLSEKIEIAKCQNDTKSLLTCSKMLGLWFYSQNGETKNTFDELFQKLFKASINPDGAPHEKVVRNIFSNFDNALNEVQLAPADLQRLRLSFPRGSQIRSWASSGLLKTLDSEDFEYAKKSFGFLNDGSPVRYAKLCEFALNPSKALPFFDTSALYFNYLEQTISQMAEIRRRQNSSRKYKHIDSPCESYHQNRFLTCGIPAVYEWLIKSASIKAEDLSASQSDIKKWAQDCLNITRPGVLEYLKENTELRDYFKNTFGIPSKSTFPSDSQLFLLRLETGNSHYLDQSHKEAGITQIVMDFMRDPEINFFCAPGYVHTISRNILALPLKQREFLETQGFKFGTELAYMPGFHSVKYPKGWDYRCDPRLDQKDQIVGVEISLIDQDGIRRYSIDYAGKIYKDDDEKFRSSFKEVKSPWDIDDLNKVPKFQSVSDIFEGNNQSFVLMVSKDGKFGEVASIRPDLHSQDFILDFGYSQRKVDIDYLKSFRIRTLSQEERGNLEIHAIISDKATLERLKGIAPNDLHTIWKELTRANPDAIIRTYGLLVEHKKKLQKFEECRRAITKKNLRSEYFIT